MRILFYSQNVLGVGHLFRTLEIMRALPGHDITLVTGGAEADLPLPKNAVQERLPGLMMDPEFSQLAPVSGNASVADVFAKRTEEFMRIMKSVRPHVFLVELFPFGRKKFGTELVPVLERVRAGDFGNCKAVCSLRDILVEKADQDKYERRVLDTLNPLFDALLVHADPSLVRLSETFSHIEDISIPLHYTGYVTPQPIQPPRRQDSIPQIIASAGSGSVGQELLHATISASEILHTTMPHELKIFSGPYAPKDDFEKQTAAARSSSHIQVERFSAHFPELLANADLSVSLAGYNTNMNLLAAGTYGLVLPFAQNREQRMRAERLQQRGALRIVEQHDLKPERLAGLMGTALSQNTPAHGIDLDGARNSARILEKLAG